MRFIFLLSLLLCITSAKGAAPDDINTALRAWFDAVDINADGDYTNNPIDSSPISTWNDKSAAGNDISSTGTTRPLYQHNSYTVNRHAVGFDGLDDRLNSVGDIWNGAVSNSDIFLVTTTDLVKSSFVFGSSSPGNIRLSSHLPWRNGATFFDHGACCVGVARLFGTVAISPLTPYVWNFQGSPTAQAVLQDGSTVLSDGGAGIYNSTASSSFALGNWAATNIGHNGRIAEAIFYQSSLNTAQRRIISSYLSAKWDKAISTSGTSADIFNGDSAANGNYDYFMGGIGQEGGNQNTATVQGLTLSDQSFLTSDGKYIAAAVDYLLTSPKTGTTASDTPTDYIFRSNRSWYIDTTGTGGEASLSFDAVAIGLPIANGEEYGLLFRSSTTGAFTEVATSTMNAGTLSFSHLPFDGIYVVGKKLNEVSLDVVKTVNNTTPNIGDTVTFTLTVSNGGPNTAVNASVIDVVPAGFDAITEISHPTGTVFSVAGNAVSWTELTVPVGSSLVATYTVEILAP